MLARRMRHKSNSAGCHHSQKYWGDKEVGGLLISVANMKNIRRQNKTGGRLPPV